jgi:KUP system potassium uptake protein
MMDRNPASLTTRKLFGSAKARTASDKTKVIPLSLVALGVVFGDGVITPAISVLSAVEGIETVSPLLDKIVVPVTICVLVALFSIQRFGTAAVGGTFGKVMLLWFLLLGVTGFVHVLRQPCILAALNPAVGLKYLFSPPRTICINESQRPKCCRFFPAPK